MRKLTIILEKIALPCMAVCLCTGWSSREWAETWGAKASVEVRVIDEDGGAVSNAEVEVYFGLSVREGATIKGKTDGNGMFAAKGKTTGEIYIDAKQKGFYDTSKKIDIAADEDRKVSWGKWMPTTIHVDAMLRRIGKPVKLLTSDFSKDYFIKEAGMTLGFDLLKQDWVKPWGHGEVVDFEVTYELDRTQGLDYAEAKLKIGFVRPFDGAYTCKLNKESTLQTVHQADTNETYQSRLLYWKKRDQNRKFSRHILSEDDILVLRTRSRVDENGNFAGAQYSMIVGGLEFGGSKNAFGLIRFRAFVNPTFNDPSLERMSIYNTPNFGMIGGLNKD